MQIPGIMINDAEGRVYPLGEEAGHLIGYVQAIYIIDLYKGIAQDQLLKQ